MVLSPSDILILTSFIPLRLLFLFSLQVLEYYGEVNPQYKNYLYYDLLNIEKNIAGALKVEQ